MKRAKKIYLYMDILDTSVYGPRVNSVSNITMTNVVT